MNRRDKLKNINMFNANLKLEQKHILENSIKIFVNNSKSIDESYGSAILSDSKYKL